MAFGSILDGPDPTKLMALVEEAIPALIDSMSEKNVSCEFSFIYKDFVTIQILHYRVGYHPGHCSLDDWSCARDMP